MPSTDKVKIAYLTHHITNDPNRVQYQRPLYLSLKNELFIFTGKSAEIPENIRKRSNIVRASLDFAGLTVLFYPIWCLYKVLSLHRKCRFDIVYSTYNYISSIAAFTLKLSGITWVADVWDHPELTLEIWRGRRKSVRMLLSYIPEFLGTRIIKKVLRHADLVISAICPESLEEYKIPPKRIFEVTNGINLTITRAKWSRRLDHDFKVFYVGFLMSIRGIDTLLNAIRMARTRMNNIKLILVGDAEKEDRDHLYKIVDAFDLRRQVVYLGRLEHNSVLSLIENADVCVFPFPRKKELDCIYPIKIFEYMAMGKAIVATRLTGVSKILRDEKDGLLVQPDNPKEIADAIFKLYKDRKLRKKLEINAKRSVRKYDWNEINSRIDDKIKRLYEC